MFARVLLSTDGSAEALAAARPAVRAAEPGGVVVLIRVVPSQDDFLLRTSAAVRDSRASSELAQQAMDSQLKEALEDLDRAERAIEEAGGRVEARLVELGDAGPRIIATAQSRECDLIAMATNGRSGWRRAILGSVADHVVRNSNEVPVMLVRRPSD